MALSHNVNLIFYGEDGEIEYGGSTKNKNKAVFDIKYIIKHYLENGYHDIIKASDLTKKELYWFTLPEKEIKKKILWLLIGLILNHGILIGIIY